MPEENKEYYKQVQIPIKIAEKVSSKTQEKIDLGLLRLKKLLKRANRFVLILILISAQVYLISAFEAHVINVTANICKPASTFTMGFWKNHPDIYNPNCLPQTLGYSNVTSVSEVNEIFDAADSEDMIDMLRAQLLAMKFNICVGVDDPDEGETFWFLDNEYTLGGLVDLADEMLMNPSNYPREILEAMKNRLDYLNNKEYIKYCSTTPYWATNIDFAKKLAQFKTVEQELLLAQINPDSLDGLITTDEQSFSEEPPVEEPPAEEPPVEEPPAEEPPVEEPTTETTTTEATSTEPTTGETTTEATTTEETTTEATSTEEITIEEPTTETTTTEATSTEVTNIESTTTESTTTE